MAQSFDRSGDRVHPFAPTHMLFPARPALRGSATLERMTQISRCT
jgi:hypothetical protein